MPEVSIGVLFGGVSEEHGVSVKSAREVAAHLDTDKYEPSWIAITHDGRWRLVEGPDGDPEGDDSRPIVLSPDRSTHGLLVQHEGGHETVRLDVVLPVLHGKLGEDGAIQGLLELSGIPYVGCGIQSSAVCMDKSLAYTIARSAGIRTPDFRIVEAGDDVDTEGLSYPVFVKPARSGSSFGVTKAADERELREALELARLYDAKILIEGAVAGKEVGCAILGTGADLITGELDRVALSHGFFRIHQEDSPETGSENSTFIVPADIPEESRLLVRETAKTIYRVLGCRGIARVDLFLTDEGTVVLNEVNTMPGLTSYSRYPRMMTAAGMPLSEVIDQLVSIAMTGERR